MIFCVVAMTGQMIKELQAILSFYHYFQTGSIKYVVSVILFLGTIIHSHYDGFTNK